EYIILQLHAFLRDYQRNSFGLGAPTDDVRAVSGAAPEDFETIARRYVAGSPVARKTLGGQLRAALNVFNALMTPAPDLDVIARRMGLPQVEHATLAADSSLWRTTHLTEHQAEHA